MCESYSIEKEKRREETRIGFKENDQTDLLLSS